MLDWLLDRVLGKQPVLHTELHTCLSHYTRNSAEVSYLQVGVCYGDEADIDDPMQPFRGHRRWSGALVEPMPSCFRALDQKYARSRNTQVVQAAVGVSRGTASLYRIAYERGGDVERDNWMDGWARLEREKLEMVVNSPFFAEFCAERGAVLSPREYAERIEEVEVQVITMADAIALTKRPPEVIVLDTEGYDRKLICSTDFSDGSCKVLVFERSGFVFDPTDWDAVRSHLDAAGFALVNADFGDDMVAIRGV